MAVIDYTCITSVSEHSKSIRLLFKLIEVPYHGVLHYFYSPMLHVLPSEYHLTFKIRSPTRPACPNLHAGKVYVLLFYSSSFAEEVTQNINYHKSSFQFYRDIKYS